jgi:hypothetical protein
MGKLKERNNITRRDFLKLVGVGAAALILPGSNSNIDSLLKIDFDNDGNLSFEEACGLAVRFDRVFQKLHKPKLDVTPLGLRKYAKEIAPQFEYEGMGPGIEVPDQLYFAHYSGGIKANHVLGSSNCMDKIEMNGRIASDISAWYGRDEFLFTLTHELAHMAQGLDICLIGPREFVETSADIAAMEVVSGLALSGNEDFFYSAVCELRSMARGASMAIALKNNDKKAFLSVVDRFGKDALSKAKFHKAMRFWDTEIAAYRTVLESYSLGPLKTIVEAIKNNSDVVDIAMKPVNFKGMGGVLHYHDGGFPMKIDDTHYLIENMEPIAQAFLKRG